MAVIKRLSAKSKVGGVLKYITNKEKTDEKIITGVDCNPETAKQEMTATKEQWDKAEGIQYHHVIQSFKPGEITPEKAHALGVELARNHFKGHECVIATHINKKHIHNHIVANSVNRETGLKYNSSKENLRQLKIENDKICEREGLSIPEKNKNRYLTMKEIETARRGESWKFKLMNQIDQAKENCNSKSEFIKNMEKVGYKVDWKDSHKYITYTTPEGKKCRDSKLLKEYSKEAMENEFSRGIEREKQTATGDRADKQPKGDRKVTPRDTAASIIFGNRQEHQVHSERTNESVTANQKEHGNERETDSGIRTEVASKREEQNRDIRAGQQSNQRLNAGNERLEGEQQSEARSNTYENNKSGASERNQLQGNFETSHGIGSSGEEHSEPILEGKGEAIRNTTISDNRIDNGNIGSSPTGEPFGEILKTLSRSIAKADEEEKAKEKARERKQLPKQQQLNNHKNKGKDYDIER